MSGPTLEQLDPGIQDVVAAMWEADIVTTDSGDGVTKFQNGHHHGALAFPHVAFVADGWEVCGAAFAIVEKLRAGEVWQVELTTSMNSRDRRPVTIGFVFSLDGAKQ